MVRALGSCSQGEYGLRRRSSDSEAACVGCVYSPLGAGQPRPSPSPPCFRTVVSVTEHVMQPSMSYQDHTCNMHLQNETGTTRSAEI